MFDDFFETKLPNLEGKVPRDRWDRPLIRPPEGVAAQFVGGKYDGYTPYHRASSFGKQIEDTYYLDLWVQRQVALGVGVDPSLPPRIQAIGPTDPWDGTRIDEQEKKRRKDALNKVVEDAKESSGSNIKSARGTAIHNATELVDLGDSLDGLDALLIERANAYWRFCREWGMVMTSVEQFGVDDEYRVAGTWDRLGWFLRKHSVLDVKTSGSMDFAGIAFAVQLATYAHACLYDIESETRTPHEQMDLETGWIIHVGREYGDPVTLHRVDIGAGRQFAYLVDKVKAAQKAGGKAITDYPEDQFTKALARCESIDQLTALWRQAERMPGLIVTAHHRAMAAQIAGNIAA